LILCVTHPLLPYCLVSWCFGLRRSRKQFPITPHTQGFTAFGFPVETSLQPGQFNEAYNNFMKLLAKVADATIIQDFRDHRDFLTERDNFNDMFDSILAFNIKIRQKYFNNQTLPNKAAYMQR
jgi:hypothetical protein